MCVSNSSGGEKIEALVDCGACVSVIRFDLVTSLQLVVSPLNSGNLNAVDGHDVVCRGTVQLTVEFEGQMVTLDKVYVIERSIFPLLLGADWILSSKVLVFGEGGRLVVRAPTLNEESTGESSSTPEDEWYDLGPLADPLPSKPVKRMIVDETTEIPASSLAYIAVCVPDFSSGVMATSPTYSAGPGREWISPSCLLTVSNGKAVLPIVNLSQSPITFNSQLEIECEHFEVDEIDNDQCETTPFVGALGGDDSPMPDWDVNPDLTSAESEAVYKLLKEYRDCFHSTGSDLGSTHAVRHKIDVGDAHPIHLPPHRASVRDRDVIAEHIKEMLAKQIITPSFSPWSSPVVLVKKKSGEVRFCVDYRRLNSITKKDVYPLPRIEDVLDRLGGAKYFSSLDLASGYWQVAMDPEHQEKTAFVTQDGLFEFRRMPFGLCNAPATFQRLMDRVLAGLKWDQCLVYLDDIVVFGQTFDEHQERLRAVLSAIRKAGLTLKTSKCRFAFQVLAVLGHVIDQDGLHPDPAKLVAVRNFPAPKNLRQLREFLGLAGYYRRFIAGFASIARPLYDLLKKSHSWSPESWSPSAATAFDTLKFKLTSAPVLMPFRDDWPCEVRTDASRNGLGAVLVQFDDDNKEHTVAFISRRLDPPELNYDGNELECLAVYWALDKLRHYVHGRDGQLTVVTDNTAVAFMQKKAAVKSKFSRWVTLISEYGATFKHRRGSSNVVADALSRNPVGSEDQSEPFACVVAPRIPGAEDIRVRQWGDDQLRPIMEALSATDTTEPIHARIFESFFLRDGVLFRRAARGRRKQLLVIPRCSRRQILEQGHAGTSGGHQGIAKSLARIGSRYWWAGWSRHVRDFVRNCPYCQLYKKPSGKPVGFLQPIPPTDIPFSTMGIDHIGPLPKTRNGNEKIFILNVVSPVFSLLFMNNLSFLCVKWSPLLLSFRICGFRLFFPPLDYWLCVLYVV